MKQLSTRALALVTTLERAPSLIGKFTGRATQDIADTLLALEGCGETSVVPYLLPFVFGANGELSRTASRIAGSMIVRASPLELVALDEDCRAKAKYAPVWAAGWSALRLALVSQLSPTTQDVTPILGAASFHANGRVREAAVKQLAHALTGAELPFLLIRLNDWVPAVAERAAQAVRMRMTVQFADRFVENWPILQRLEGSRRRDHRPMLGDVRVLLKETGCRSAVERGLEVGDAGTRRFLFRVARDRPDFDRAALLGRALSDSDIGVRLDAVKAAHHALSIAELRDVPPRLVADPYPRIRVEGVLVAVDRLGAEAQPILRSALIDRSRSVREIGRFHLRRTDERADFAKLYRNRLAPFAARGNGMPLVIAIAGLGETGTEADTTMLATHLTHGRPSVRRATVRAIGALAFGREVPTIVGMLRDSSPDVTRAARQVLSPRASQVGIEALLTILRDHELAHSRFDAFTIGMSLGKWESLWMILETVTDRDEKLRAAAVRWLHVWLGRHNRRSVQPTRDQLNTIGRLLDARQAALDARIIAEIRAIHRYWDGKSTPIPK